MAEENQICPSCQAVIRSRALFCYKCGASIVTNSSAKSKKGGRKKTAELVSEAIDGAEKKDEVSNVWFQDKIVEEQVAEEVEEQKADEVMEEVKIASTPSIQEKAKLESAASMRQKAKTIQKKQIEVVWEQPNTSNIWFFLGTIIFAAIAFAVVFLAWTLR
jgi:dGTP triphosphohydrolase